MNRPEISTGLPSAGPLTAWPDVTTAQADELLDQALAGLEFGDVDRAARAGLTGLDPAIAAAVVASWARRAWTAGVAVGRAEVVEETPAVQAARAETRAAAKKLTQARAKARATARKLTQAQAARAQAYRWWQDATAERDEARDDLAAATAAGERYGLVVDEVVAATAEARLLAGDDTTDATAALRDLLVRIERALDQLGGEGR